MALTWALWLMLWGGYNAEVNRAFQPDFPSDVLDLLHGLRALLPLLAAFLAVLNLLARRPLPYWALQGPLGLLALYGLVGVSASILLSPQPLTALLWALQYLSVLLVVWASLGDSNPIPRLVRLIKLNWIVVASLTCVLLAAVMFDRDVVLSPGGLLLLQPSGENPALPDQLLGMATTRSTGVGRYAAVAALVAVAGLCRGTRRSRILWFVVLFFSLRGLVYVQARTALLAFLPAGFLPLWLQRSTRYVFLAAAFLAVLLLAATGSYQAFWAYLTRGEPFDTSLTGRALLWEQVWELLPESPLLGYGFWADRILVRNDIHNALLHALIQTGLLGTALFVAAVGGTWILVFRLYSARPPRDMATVLIEIPGAILFFTLASALESTFALYGVPWLLLAPCIAYLQALRRQQQIAEKGVARFERLALPS